MGKSFGARGAFTVLARSWLVIIVITGLFAAGGLAYCLIKEPEYQATSTMLAVSGTRDSQSGAYENAMGSEQRVTSYAGLVYSDAVLSPARTSAGVSMSLDELRGRVSASTTPGTSILTISATSTDPDTAVRLATAVSDSMVQLVSRVEIAPGARQASTRLVTVTPALLESKPVSPKPLVTTLLVAVLGLVVGIIAALLLEQLNRRVRDRKDVAAVLTHQAVANPLVAEGSDGVSAIAAELVRQGRGRGSVTTCVVPLSAAAAASATAVAQELRGRLSTAGDPAVLMGLSGSGADSELPIDSWRGMGTKASAPALVGDALGAVSENTSFVVVEGPEVVGDDPTVPIVDLLPTIDSVVVVLEAKKSRLDDLANSVPLTGGADREGIYYQLVSKSDQRRFETEHQTTTHDTAGEPAGVAGDMGADRSMVP